MNRKMAIGTGGLVIVSIVAIAVHLAVLSAVADTQSGNSPFTALSLVEGKNQGVLAPGESRWYKLTRTSFDGASQQRADLTLIFTPDDGQRVQRVNFQIFPADQLVYWYQGDNSKMHNLGAGGIVSRDGNPLTGELLWSGWINNNDAYYVQVFNSADVSIDYWLFTGDIVRAELGANAAPAPAADVPAGANPNHPLPLTADLQKGRLPAGGETWYTLLYNDFDSQADEEHIFNLIFTPDDGNRIHRVGFEIFPLEQLHIWQRGDTDQMHNIGAGSIVSRDGDPTTGELLWSGWLMDGQTYLLKIYNGADADIDYWFFQKDMPHPLLGNVAPPASPVDVLPGTDPFHTLTIDGGINKGRLAPGQERWYSFVRDDYDDAVQEHTAFTLMFTPDDGNRVHRVNFELFTAGELHIWARGDTDRMRNFGAGSVVSRDGNSETGELLWSGWLMDKEVYYAKVRNDADTTIDYWLFPGDIVRAELGEPTQQPPASSVVSAGADPNHPLLLAMGLNKGSLNPGQERWFSFTRNDFDQDKMEPMALSLFFTPDDGQRIHRVNFEIFPASELGIWQRGDTDQLNNLGAGGVVSRDGDPNTGERLWSGWLMDGATYYVRLRNDADVAVDYWLFTADVLHPELGTLSAP